MILTSLGLKKPAREDGYNLEDQVNFNTQKVDDFLSASLRPPTATVVAQALTVVLEADSYIDGQEVKFYLPSDVTGGDITLTIKKADETVICNALNLKDYEGVNVADLSKGYVTCYFQDDVTDFFEYAPSGGGGLDATFGGGGDGDLNTTGDILFEVDEGDYVVKKYNNININAGHSLYVNGRCQGMILYAEGDVVIDGKIDLSGALSEKISDRVPQVVVNKTTNNPYIKETLLPAPIWWNSAFTADATEKAKFNDNDDNIGASMGIVSNDFPNGQDILVLDLGEVKFVEYLLTKLYFYGHYAKVAISDDNSNWTEFRDEINMYGTTERKFEIYQKCRYIKLIDVYKGNGVAGISLYYVKVKTSQLKPFTNYNDPLMLLQELGDIFNVRGGRGGNGGMGTYARGYGGLYRGGYGGPGRKNGGGFGGGGGASSSIGGDIIHANNGGGPTIAKLPYGTPSPGEDPVKGQGGRSYVGLQASQCTYQIYTNQTGKAGGGFGGGGGGAGGVAYTGNASNNKGGDGEDGSHAAAMIMLIVKGSITISATGQILSNSGKGGDGGDSIANNTGSYYMNGGSGGGGAGGGIVAILHQGTFTNNGTIEVNGGLGGAFGLGSEPGSTDGGAGQDGEIGTIFIKNVADLI